MKRRESIFGGIPRGFGIFALSPAGFLLTADISTEITIEPKGERATTFKAISIEKVQIDQFMISEKMPVPLQFKAAGDFVDFDFLIDGKREPNHVYLGRQCWNPQTIPFRLENRPVVVPQQSLGVVAPDKSSVPVGADPGRATSSQLPAPSGSSGSGGGSGGQKTSETQRR